MKIYLTLLIVITLFSCNSEIIESTKKALEPIVIEEKTTLSGIKYFDFDQVDHYKTTLSKYESEMFKIDDTTLSKSDSLEQALLLGKTPINFKDAAFIKIFSELDYSKKEIPNFKLKEFGYVFSEKEFKENDCA
tara:strand:- start:126 stop:527 length:402 start_codon:yes stop_codon:yes gene_type:complete